jgi:uncharacterized heparinase superfamily protein
MTTRSPEQGMELLYDLLTLEDVLIQRGRIIPPRIAELIGSLREATRFFRMGDGRLCSFHGGGRSSELRVETVLDLAETPVDSPLQGRRSGFHRLGGPDMEVMVDAGPPPSGPWSVNACLQPLALEIMLQGERLFTGCGWTPEYGAGPDLRLAAGACTVEVGSTSPGRLALRSEASPLGAQLVDAPLAVQVDRHKAEDATWLQMSHAGWANPFGLSHHRNLYLDLSAGELRGEDRFVPLIGASPKRRARQFAVHFHVDPAVQVTRSEDGKSFIMELPSGRKFCLQTDALDTYLEASDIHEQDVTWPTSQIVLCGPISEQDNGARVRWKLDEVACPPSPPEQEPGDLD